MRTFRAGIAAAAGLAVLMAAPAGCTSGPEPAYTPAASAAPSLKPSDAVPSPSVSLPPSPIPASPTPVPSPSSEARTSAKPSPTAAATAKPAPGGTAANERKALSWYYMRKGEGKVPGFPSDIRLYKPEHKVIYVGTGKKVYLTIDNGGAMGDYNRWLDILKEHDVKANFFIAGYNLKKAPDFLKRLVEEGHLVANHTMTHKDFTTLSDDQVREEIEEYAKLYKEMTGQEIQPYFRFPYGKYSLKLLDIVSEMGYTSVFWSTAMRDWEPRKNGWKDAHADILNNLHDGNVILMHQASEDNLEALDAIIRDVKERGYEFGLVSEIQLPESR
jgi:peptidoglycan-N-acetylmuramic acid deacetylase